MKDRQRIEEIEIDIEKKRNKANINTQNTHTSPDLIWPVNRNEAVNLSRDYEASVWDEKKLWIMKSR